MSHLAVNSDDPIEPGALAEALAPLPQGAPIVVMIHGFKFSPHDAARNPHEHILSLSPRRDCWKAVSWPRHLGLKGDAGLAVAFGWPARGSIWTAWKASEAAGARLSRLIAALRAAAPDRPLHLIAHSLGARVALRSLEGLPAGSVDRMILISAALFRTEAARLAATPAGQTAQVFNILGRENTLFDALLRLAMPHAGRTLGQRGPEARGWLDIRLDCTESLARLAGLGYRIAAPRAPICHWSGYLRPGVWKLYRAVLLTPETTPQPYLAALLAETGMPARWSAGGLAGVLRMPMGQ